jgi:nicotinamidase-related amidase
MNRSTEVPAYQLKEEVRLDPARTALLVIDMQNDFVRSGGSLLVADAEATIAAISHLLDLARIWPEHAREGSWGWQIVDELAPTRHNLVLRKPRYDAFYGTPLDHQLRLWGIATRS